MVGSPAVAAAVAQFGFWVLLALGAYYGELNRKWLAAFVALWAAGFFGLPRLSPDGGWYVTTWIAVLDIALVLLVFKKDIRLS
jgi:hypothetical protein